MASSQLDVCSCTRPVSSLDGSVAVPQLDGRRGGTAYTLRVDVNRQLVTILRSVFGKITTEATPEGELAVRFAYRHPETGDALVVVEGDEVAVYIGGITPGHFTRLDVDPPERGRAIAEDVAAFLSARFADRIVLWSKTLSGRMALSR